MEKSDSQRTTLGKDGRRRENKKENCIVFLIQLNI